MPKKNTKAKKNSNAKEAQKPINLLKQDHDEVKKLFKQFEEAKTPAQKEKIAREAIMELKIHATLEEEMFYPEVRDFLGDEEDMIDLVDEALEEHHVAKLLMEELDQMHPEDERFEAKFLVLAESVKHHMEEEETELFPKAKKSEVNDDDLGEEIQARKKELQKRVMRSATARSQDLAA